MLDNKKLTARVGWMIKELQKNWGISLYRIAVETKIPHSSLKYMLEGKFEWKLNHLFTLVDFFRKYGVKVSIPNLIDFEKDHPISKIFDVTKADFREAMIPLRLKKYGFKPLGAPPQQQKVDPNDPEYLANTLWRDILDLTKENKLSKNSKIEVSLKISGKNINFEQNSTVGKKS